QLGHLRVTLQTFQIEQGIDRQTPMSQPFLAQVNAFEKRLILASSRRQTRELLEARILARRDLLHRRLLRALFKHQMRDMHLGNLALDVLSRAMSDGCETATM